jgi:transposase InsO family protein
VILDLFTRKLVGWAMRDHLRAELTIAALTMAIQRRRPGPGLIHHSDRGSQDAAGHYRKTLQAAALTHSMSRKANCWDDAPMESFFGTLKPNWCIRTNTPTPRPHDATCSGTSKAITIVGRSMPLLATSPQSSQTAKPHNPVSPFPREGQVLRSLNVDILVVPPLEGSDQAH